MLSKVLKKKKRVPSAVSAVRSEDAVFETPLFRKRLWIHWKEGQSGCV